MAEPRFNRLKGNVDRIERSIATAKRSLKTNKKFAEGVDYSEELRAKSLRDYKLDQNELKKLEEDLKQAEKDLEEFKANERSKKGEEEAKVIERQYARLEEALSLQLDPTSASAKKIKDDMEGLVDDYRGALTSINKRAVNKIEARAQLTKTKVPGFGSPTDTATPTPAVTATPTATPAVTPTTPPGSKAIPSGTTGTRTGKGKLEVQAGPGFKPGKPTGKLEVQAGPGFKPDAPVTPGQTPLDTLLAKTDFWYDLPDYIFKLDKKLGDLLVEAVDNGWDNEKFLAKARLTPWWQKNSDKIRTRIVDRAKYDELKAAGEDVTKSDYGLYLSKQMNSIKARAKAIAGATLTDEQAQSVAQKIYDGNLDDDPLAINALIIPFIGKTTSIVGTGVGRTQTGFGGEALQNYQTLQGIAKANGFSLKDILPNVSAITAGGDIETAVLRGLADGSIDINRVAQDARMLASQGQPEYVRNLLNQGYDLEAVYAPYRRTMATELELDPNQIDLNDSTLRMAITDKGDMNLYDFKKALRQDNRWQYTGAAKEQVSDAALKVLRDFGFQG
jgi:hypothetical protein